MKNLKKGQEFTTITGRKFIISGIWFLGHNISTIEVKPINGEDEIYYKLSDFEQAIEDKKISLILKKQL